MDKLSNKNYWDSVHDNQAPEFKENSFRKKLKFLAKKIMGEKSLRYYSDYLLWDVIFPKYLPSTKGLKVIEIGSAPGEMLIRLRDLFSFIPYGVEYSESGVEVNRKNFIAHNIDPANVIHADFLSPDFQEKHKSSFDIVLSAGFIEHFTNVQEVIGKHISLLNRGGHLVVIIPNLRGINYILCYIFNRNILPMHNIAIMKKNEFCGLFDPVILETKLCGYYGTFDFGMFNTKEKSLMRFLLGFCKICQAFLNIIFPWLFKDKGAESSFLSPFLIFIGVKKQ